LGPPEIPADRVTALRRAFADTMRDPEFVDEATRSRLTVDPVSGEEIEALVDELYATPLSVIEKTRSILR
jgi:tripartite-type tricarboxylate transporter receptor subunit TctC